MDMITPQITEKPEFKVKTIQFVWNTHVLYLEIKIYDNGKRSYLIKDELGNESDYSQREYGKPIHKDSIFIPVPFGRLKTQLKVEDKKVEMIKEGLNVIKNNIDYLKFIQYIYEYVAKLEDCNLEKVNFNN